MGRLLRPLLSEEKSRQCDKQTASDLTGITDNIDISYRDSHWKKWWYAWMFRCGIVMCQVRCSAGAGSRGWKRTMFLRKHVRRLVTHCSIELLVLLLGGINFTPVSLRGLQKELCVPGYYYD
ncbi:hypothetical protein CAPTEDRAFT_201059 [Capitella teleta]|uniref:Uncharacterized protein n=1 Tax=Capitella teleta TaxID=283909 RepID=R7TNI8_CAPTE|nr:hypothetical protein CAPTEDRAFT_201059 [Capitella teleta]|eukprot:ELT93111.1 hypothetical protein CAPTEDRAFT_201059 [Capitella teleta]